MLVTGTSCIKSVRAARCKACFTRLYVVNPEIAVEGYEAEAAVTKIKIRPVPVLAKAQTKEKNKATQTLASVNDGRCCVPASTPVIA